MPLEPISSGGRYGQAFLTIDKQKRLSFSSTVRKELRLNSGLDWVVLAIDTENMRIGVVRQDLAKVKNVNAFKVDGRGYTSARALIDKLALDMSDAPFRFTDAGWVDESGQRWRCFELGRD